MTDIDEIDAKFRRGMSILADGTSGREWPHAIALIEAAAAAGHLEAGERCALFNCMGLGRPPNWQKGLDELTTAAERGSVSAGSALILLAENRFVAEFPEPPSTNYWRTVRSSIPIAERLSPPPRRVLSSSPLILSSEAFASPAECAWIVNAAIRRLEPAFVQDRRTGHRILDSNRTNTGATFPVIQMDVVLEMIRARICAALGVPPAHLEVMQALHYSVGEEFRPHHDFFDLSSEGLRAEAARNGQRAATVLVYLNDDFTGGETYFPEIDLRYRGKIGDALIFSNLDRAGMPEPATLHAGLSPTSGEKWILSQWVRDRPLTAGY